MKGKKVFKHPAGYSFASRNELEIISKNGAIIRPARRTFLEIS